MKRYLKSLVAVAAIALGGIHVAYAGDFKLEDVTFGGGQFVIVGDPHGLVLTSADGIDWVAQTTGSRYDSLKSVAWGNGRYVAVGDQGWVLTSLTGRHWVKHRVPAMEEARRIAWVEDEFLAVGRGGLILTSHDGVNWTKQDSGTTDDLVGIAGGNGQIMVVGKRGAVLRSSDARAWTTERIEGVRSLDSVASDGKVFVAVDDLGFRSVIARSHKEGAWEVDNFEGSVREMSDVAYGGGRFVAVGADIATSPDGGDWTFLNARNPSTNWSLLLGRVAVGNGTYVAIGYGRGHSAIFISRDGWTWRGAEGLSIDPRETLTLPNTLAKTSPIAEGKQWAREWRRHLLVGGLMGFVMSGVGVVLYIWLQVWAIIRTRGIWLVFSMLPILAAARILMTTTAAYPLAPNLGMQHLIAYLVVLLITDALWKKYRHKAHDITELEGDPHSPLP